MGIFRKAVSALETDKSRGLCSFCVGEVVSAKVLSWTVPTIHTDNVKLKHPWPSVAEGSADSPGAEGTACEKRSFAER